MKRRGFVRPQPPGAHVATAPASVDVTRLKARDLCTMSEERFRDVGSQLYQLYEEDRKHSQLFYYQPVSSEARKVHEATEHLIGVGGGNGSSKTETCMVDDIIAATGVIPDSLNLQPGEPGYIDWDSKMPKGPVNCRMIVESLTTTLEQTILPKLQWWHWTGVDAPGGRRGHYGWVPKWCLLDGSWEKSWLSRTRTLKVLKRDPKNLDTILGISKLQFMSHEQDPQDFASGDFQRVLMDEPPRYRIFTENQARVMRANGVLKLAMTWPDDPSIPVDWIFDEVYEPGQIGPAKNADTLWLNLYSTDNPYIDQESLGRQAEKWSAEMRSIRIEGKPIRFSNLIYPLFTKQDDWWCFACGKRVYPKVVDGEPRCGVCLGNEVTVYTHVTEDDIDTFHPCVMVLDPHPRKPHMFSFFQIDPNDDWLQFDELEVDGSPEEAVDAVEALEEKHSASVVARYIDPNMGRSPSSAANREETWQDAFADDGLRCELADDANTGLQKVNKLFAPDDRTRKPRIRIHRRCKNTIYQLQRFSWAEWKGVKDERDVKQVPRDKYNDYGTNLKYLINAQLTFDLLRRGPEIIRRMPGAHAGDRRPGMRETQPGARRSSRTSARSVAASMGR